MGKESKLMTIAEQLEAHNGTMRLRAFCRLMGISNDTGYKWVREDGLPAAKIGGTLWIDPVAASAWWRARMTLSKPPGISPHRKLKGGEDLEVHV